MFEELLRLWSDRELLREIVRAHPYLGPFLFVLLQALQVVVAPIPGEATGFVAGFLFGAFYGFLLSSLGIFLGSGVAFLIARAFRSYFLKKFGEHPFYLKILKVFARYGHTGTFFLYLFPGFPKDLLNYLLGLMPISLRSFLLLSTLGRAPGTFALALQGDVVYGGHPLRILFVTLAFLLTFLAFFLLKRRLERYLV